MNTSKRYVSAVDENICIFTCFGIHSETHMELDAGITGRSKNFRVSGLDGTFAPSKFGNFNGIFFELKFFFRLFSLFCQENPFFL